MADQSRMHRFQVGDRVAVPDRENAEGEILAFANEELTYLEVQLDNENDSIVVTEDEVRRVAA